MPLASGTRFGPYEIVAPLGAGGMGEVYRARDTRLGRDVAIKVLPQHLSANPEVRARFEREAKTISSLNHPNICVLFDVGREGDTDFLVMELVEGETLAERLRRGPLSSAELLRLGTQIADALDRAHRAGVIHRDLKPANVMITKSGAKLMDFGLSRVTGMAGPASGSGQTMAALTQSPTIAQALTAEGTILGTFQYMSPEQLEGKEADARSDIWALGCVLYEMVTGRRAFEGRSQASLIAAILEREPAPVGEAPSGSTVVGGPPQGIERLIRNCLAKDPDERIQTAHDVKLHLQGIAEAAGLSRTSVVSVPAVAAAATARPRRGGGSRLAWALAFVGLAAAALAFTTLYPRATAPPPAFRFQIAPIPKATETFWPRVSPDGKYLIVLATDSTTLERAYLRPMDQTEAHAIPGTEGLQRAYWSPDSREIAFVANGKIQRVPIAGGSPTVVTAAPGGADLSWGSKGLILMDGQFTDSLKVVPAGGGDLRPASRIDRAAKEVGSAWPCFLPDGQHFLFIGNLGSGVAGNIRLGRIGSLDSKLLGRSDGRVEYAPGGWALYLRGSTLLAQKLDLGAGKLTGQPITLVEDVRVGSSSGHFSISRTGVLAVARMTGGEMRTIRTVNRAGDPSGEPVATGVIGAPSLSPDGRRVLYQRTGPGAGAGGEVYVKDLERGTDSRLTFTDDAAFTPVWAPDGRRYAYVTRPASGAVRLHVSTLDGMGPQDSISVPNPSASLTQWSAAGSRLVCFDTRGHTFAVSLEGDRTSQPLADTTRVLVHSRISPDGRWLACASGLPPNLQIFVYSLTGAPGRWQISTTPGFMPRWARDGRELIYESAEGRLMAVDIDTRDGFHAGAPRTLFTLPQRLLNYETWSWDCDASAERFYLVVPQQGQSAGTIEVVTGFKGLVSRR